MRPSEEVRRKGLKVNGRRRVSYASRAHVLIVSSGHHQGRFQLDALPLQADLLYEDTLFPNYVVSTSRHPARCKFAVQWLQSRGS